MISDTQVRMAWGQTLGVSKSPDQAADLEQYKFELHVSIYMDHMNYGKLYANFSNIKKNVCRISCARWRTCLYPGIQGVVTVNIKLTMCYFSYYFITLLSNNYMTMQHASLS